MGGKTKPMKALVTGGGGFLGTRISQMLQARGDKVVSLGRHRYPHLEEVGIETFQADIRDFDALGRACESAEVVFHVASLTAIWGQRKTFWAINVEGTRNVIEQCRRHGIKKLVYTSTPSVVFGDKELCGVDESLPYPKRFLAHYPETKAAAERMVLEANGPEFSTVAIRPHLIWGPGDPHLIPRVIERARTGKLIQVGDGRNLADITYIDNAAEAHLQAADVVEPGAACCGRAYFISQGEPVQLWAWLNELLEAVGVPTVKRQISYRLARRIGRLLELSYRVTGRRSEPRMTRFVAAQLATSHYFDISAARRDLGYHPTVSTSEGVRRLLASLRS